MGLSLRNIGKKITDFAGAAERQINPFDHGATASNPNPRNLAPPTPSRFTGGAYGNTPQASLLPVKQINMFDSSPDSNIADVKRLNANQPFLDAAHSKNRSDSPLQALQGAARTVPELLASIRPGTATYHPNSPIEQALFSKTPVKNIQKKVVDTYNAHPGGGALPLAIGEGALSVGSDLPVGKVIGTAAKSIVPTSKAELRALKSEIGAVGAGTVKQTVKVSAKDKKVAQQTINDIDAKAYKERRSLTKSEQIKVGSNLEKIHGKPAARVKAPPVPKVDVPLTETPVQSENLLHKAYPIVDRLRRMGGAHEDLANVLVNKRNAGEKGYAAAKFATPTVNKLNKEDFSAAVDHLEGTVKSKDPTIVQAAKEMKGQLDQVHDLAVQHGGQVNYRQNYFPHFNDIPKAGDGGYQSALDHLVKTKQAKDVGEASKLLEYSRRAGGQKKFANFEKTRQADLPNYPKTIEAYHHYLEGAHSKVADFQHLGPKDEKLGEIINNIHAQGGDVEKARELFNVADSRKVYGQKGEKISSALTTFQGITKLGTSFIGNAAQQGNNIVAGGLGRTAKAAAKLVSKQGDRDFVQQTGVTGEGVARESMESRTGAFSKGFSKNRVRQITAPGFENVEKANRAVAAVTGRDQARTIAGRLAKARSTGNEAQTAKLEQQLRTKFNIQGEIGEKLTHDQEINAARKFVERTQFRTGAQDLPAGATSPTGRVLTQFKRYPFKQGAYIKREILDPLIKEGNPLPLVRATGIGLPVGFGLNAARNKLTGSEHSDDSAATRTLDAAAAGGLTGLETSLVRGLDPRKSKNGDAYATKVERTLGGPTISDILTSGKAGFTAATGTGQGNDPSRFTALERAAVSHVPDVGPSISNRALPYKKADGSVAGAAPDTSKPLSASERIKQSFTSDDDKKFLKLSDADKKAAAQTDPKMRGIYQEWLGAKAAFASPKLYNDGLDPDSTSVLNRYDRLTTGGKTKVANRDNGWEYKVALAQYNNKKLDPDWTDAKDIRAQQDLAKKYVGKDFGKNTRDIYGLSKQEVSDYVTAHPDQADAILKYDQALVGAGIIKKGKFANGFGPDSGSKKAKVSPFADAYAFTIASKAGTKKKASITAKVPQIAKAKARSRTSSSKATIKARAV